MKEAQYPFRKKYHHDFHILRDLSAEVTQGEILSIIGNGSGKSTLLKILAAVLSPTSGKAVVNGIVSALLVPGAVLIPSLQDSEISILTAPFWITLARMLIKNLTRFPPLLI